MPKNENEIRERLEKIQSSLESWTKELNLLSEKIQEAEFFLELINGTPSRM